MMYRVQSNSLAHVGFVIVADPWGDLTEAEAEQALAEAGAEKRCPFPGSCFESQCRDHGGRHLGWACRLERGCDN